MSEKGKFRGPRKWLSLQEKLEIIDCHENGASYAKIAFDRGMNESSVRAIIKKKAQYKEYESLASPFMTQAVTKHRSPLMIDMERLLLIWIEDCNQNNIPLNQTAIQTKATTLYNKLKANREQKGEDNNKETFIASRGWFFRFKNRVELHNARIISSLSEKEKLPEELKKDVEQFLKAHQNKGRWRKRPPRTYLVDRLQSKYINENEKESEFETVDIASLCECIDSSQSNEPDNILLEANKACDSEGDGRLNPEEPSEGTSERNLQEELSEGNMRKELSMDDLERILQAIDNVSKLITNGDMNVERSTKVRQYLEDAVRCYRDLYTEQRKNELRF